MILKNSDGKYFTKSFWKGVLVVALFLIWWVGFISFESSLFLIVPVLVGISYLLFMPILAMRRKPNVLNPTRVIKIYFLLISLLPSSYLGLLFLGGLLMGGVEGVRNVPFLIIISIMCVVIIIFGIPQVASLYIGKDYFVSKTVTIIYYWVIGLLGVTSIVTIFNIFL